jgi:hypothetical protein
MPEQPPHADQTIAHAASTPGQSRHDHRPARRPRSHRLRAPATVVGQSVCCGNRAHTMIAWPLYKVARLRHATPVQGRRNGTPICPRGEGGHGAFGKGWSRRRSLIGGTRTRRHAGAVEADDCPCDLEQRPTASLSQRRLGAGSKANMDRDGRNSRMPRWQARTSGRPIASPIRACAPLHGRERGTASARRS